MWQAACVVLAFSPLFPKKWDLVKFGADGIPDAIRARLWAGPCWVISVTGISQRTRGKYIVLGSER